MLTLLIVGFVAVSIVMGLLEAAGPVADVIIIAAVSLGGAFSVVGGFRWRAAYWSGPARTPEQRLAQRRQGMRRLGLGPTATLGAPFVLGYLLAVLVNTVGHYVTVEERDAVALVAEWERRYGSECR